MNRTEKTAQIADVKGRFDRAISVALVDYQGLTVETVTALRREFRKAGVDYKVVKNTVIRHALKESAYQSLVGDVSPDRKNSPKPHAAVRGMTGVAWSYTDPAAPAKIVEQFKKDNAGKADSLKVKTGLLGGQLIDAERLAKVPGLKETQGTIVGLISAPAAQLVGMIQAPAAQIVGILQAWVAKREASGG